MHLVTAYAISGILASILTGYVHEEFCYIYEVNAYIGFCEWALLKYIDYSHSLYVVVAVFEDYWCGIMHLGNVLYIQYQSAPGVAEKAVQQTPKVPVTGVQYTPSVSEKAVLGSKMTSMQMLLV